MPSARIRDRITAINKLKERQKVVASRVPEQDVIALVLGGEKVSIQVFRFAGGKLYDRESFLLNADDEPEQIRSEFVMQYYSMRDSPPRHHDLSSRQRRRRHEWRRESGAPREVPHSAKG